MLKFHCQPKIRVENGMPGWLLFHVMVPRDCKGVLMKRSMTLDSWNFPKNDSALNELLGKADLLTTDEERGEMDAATKRIDRNRAGA